MASASSLRNGEFVGALDCGTTSARFIIFDERATIIAQHQVEFTQYYPNPGWHEHDPEEIIDTVRVCISEAVKNLENAGWTKDSVKTIGITNQRETTVAWDKTTGKSLCRAIVWDDARTKGIVAHYTDKLNTEGIEHPVTTPTSDAPGNGKDKLARVWGPEAHTVVRSMTGLPLSTYFSAIKLRWMLQHHESVQRAHESDTLLFGTIDSWICYNLLTPAKDSQNKEEKVHITDPTNASRTLLYDLSSLSWSDCMLSFFELRPSILPRLVTSSEVYGHLDTSTALPGVSVAGMAGDQQAALVGNKCLVKGDAKCTYGTGAFLLFCTGDKVVRSAHGLLSTVAFQYSAKGDGHVKTVYALEGSIAVAGSAIKWLRDGIGLIKRTPDVNTLAASVENTAGVYFVTAFGGLLAPYWDPTAAGMLIGLTSYTTPAHIARATLEATAFQTRAILESMYLDAEHKDEKKEIKVDGGMTNGDVAMQILADVVGFEILRPMMRESTALGSALLAGSAIGLYGWDLSKPETFARVNSQGSSIFKPMIQTESREARWKLWKQAVERSKGWE